MQAGQDSDGGVGGWKAMGTLHARFMLCIVFVTMLSERVDDLFTSTIRLYLSPFQLNLLFWGIVPCAPALTNTCHDARFAPHVGAHVNAG